MPNGCCIIILKFQRLCSKVICSSHLFPQEYSPGDNVLIENLHILLTSIEDLYETGKFNGPEERFFGMVEKSASMRPVSMRQLTSANL